MSWSNLALARVAGACLRLRPGLHAIMGSGSFLLVLAAMALAESSSEPVTETPPWLVRSWQTKDGLPQNSVQAIAQTAQGYLWVGTKGGLARFDGVRFQPYGLAEGLKGVNITDLLADADGGLWIGTIGEA